jgi:hypothetical protein
MMRRILLGVVFAAFCSWGCCPAALRLFAQPSRLAMVPSPRGCLNRLDSGTTRRFRIR